MKMGGQVRAVGGMGLLVLGWDLGAALSMAEALGYSTLAAAEILPAIEHEAVRALNEQARQGGADG